MGLWCGWGVHEIKRFIRPFFGFQRVIVFNKSALLVGLALPGMRLGFLST